MENKKRLYLNSCSFLYADRMISPNYILSENSQLSKLFCSSSYIASAMGSNNESIFRRTLIDCSKNNFDFAIIGWSHPERALILNNSIDLSYDKLKEESQKSFLGNTSDRLLYGYDNIIPFQNGGNYSLLKFEPKGTDDTILYTISLHNFFKQKGIPHLFLNMGKLDENIISIRESWLQGIDPKNYLSVNDSDNIVEKMSFCFTEYYAKKAEKTIVKDLKIHEFKSLSGNSDIEYAKTGWLADCGGHPGKLAYQDLFHLIYEHIIKNNLVY
jgi:hypothetical protein